jgi:Rrf2 family nitric oxide-sensitive transcriptional repressor
VHSVRGRNGGFRLTRPADEITFGAVIRKTEDSLELFECFNFGFTGVGNNQNTIG